MIIDDNHRVVFVHIPKCGGTSVARQFGQLDTSRLFRRKGEHDRLGLIHYAHIPLYYLRDHYPDEFAKVAAYDSFALLRDPHARFASATFQRIEEFGGVPRIQITGKRALAEARQVIHWLKQRDRFCDLEYIHFSRQCDYIFLDGEQIVRNIYTIEDMQIFGEDLGRITLLNFDADRRENANFASPYSGVFALLHGLKPIYSRLTSWALRERILLLLQSWNLQKPTSMYEAFRRDPEISDFVESYYAEDFALRRAAQQRMETLKAARSLGPGASVDRSVDLAPTT
jgi:hypothetical protein